VREGCERFVLATPLIGRHNLENALVALGMAALAGVPLDVSLDALRTAHGAPGRLQPVTLEGGTALPRVFVDYAHTPDALDNVLSALAPLVRARGGRLSVVFGAGGDRDKGKRPEMAKTCQGLADRVIATSDNPRTEDPEAILDDIVAGFSPTFSFTREVDRARAIALAIREAGPDDAVLIAGKGHEDYQVIGTTKHPFDDVAVARQALLARANSTAEAAR
jgi:UDP-N-acetylmuramoyl-L-alanyl-D-glutamate--2,6-diaminopimelate ligase